MTTKTRAERKAAPQRLTRAVVNVQFKAASANEEERTFEGLAAVWDLDLGGDIIHQGAFKKTLAEWKSSGEALPLLNSHDHFDIMSALGQLLEAKETKDGLWTKWEVIDGPEGDAVMRRLRPSERTGRAIVGKMSIGFEPVKFSFEQPEGTTSFWDRIRIIDEAKLREVSLVLFPMAPGASIDVSTVKSFMQSADATDPKTLTPEMKVKLRQLAGKIGKLLAKKDAETPPNTPPAPPEDVDDELDDELDDSTPPGDAVDDDEEDLAEDDEEDTEGAEKGKSGKAPETKEGVAIYQFPDALQQRLQKTLLRGKMSDTTNPNKE